MSVVLLSLLFMHNRCVRYFGGQFNNNAENGGFQVVWGLGCGGLGVWQIESVLSSPSSLCLLRTACDPVVHGVVERSAVHPLQGSYLHPPTLIALCALVKTTTTTTTMMMMMRWQWYSNLHPRSLIALCTLDQHCCCWCSNITFTRLKHIMHTITILTGNSAICTMSCADTISMHHHEHYVHCSVLNAHRLLC